MADPSPFPLGSLTQKAKGTSEPWQESGSSVELLDGPMDGWVAPTDADSAWIAACSPDQILALASALQTFRAELVKRIERNKRIAAEFELAEESGFIVDNERGAFELILQLFDRAVSLDPEGRQE
jgi:hypothetical protein